MTRAFRRLRPVFSTGVRRSSESRAAEHERLAASRLMVVCSLLVYCAEFVLAGDLYPMLSICMYVFVRELCCTEFVLAGDLYPTLFVTIFITYFCFITIITYK